VYLGVPSSLSPSICTHLCASTPGSGASKPTGPASLPQDPPLICQGKRRVDIPHGHLARSHLQVTAVTGIGGGTLGAVLQILLLWPLVQQ